MRLRRASDNVPRRYPVKIPRLSIPVRLLTLWLVLLAGRVAPCQDPAAGKGAKASTAPPAAGGAAQPAPAKPAFKPEEIEQFVAPIALYPDSLVSQILMASTYPLEVIEASRWTKADKDLKGDKLTAALEKKTWDPSVKSLVNFPPVLAMMDEKLENTQKLGDAFLQSQKDVLDAIQRLRVKAEKEGNLKSNEQQKVVKEETVIKIESTNPQVVYVPTYNPTVVYGPWPYPAYPPYSYYPPGYVAASAAVSFGVGLAVGAAWGYAWGGCNWGHGDVDVDINRNTNINNNIDRSKNINNMSRGADGRNSFQHDASHRKGVSYRDQATAQKYNRGTNSATAQSREAYRGRADQGRQSLDRGGATTASARDRAGGTGTRASPSTANRASGTSKSSDAFSGVSRGSDTRAESSRGSQSRSSSASRGSSGGSRSSGASRGGGGRGGGGRGGGGRR
jgi:hypothetical protein